MTLSGMPYVIDVEASGFGAGSYPIEIGIALPDGTGTCFLIRPEPEWIHWDDRAEAVHGICRTQLAQNGLPVQDAARLLNKVVDGHTVYTDAWGVDRAWVALLFDAAGIRQSFQLESIRALMTDEQAGTWASTRDRVARDLSLIRHRASSDARIVQMTCHRVLGKDSELFSD